jgi:hypothetical protein
MRIADSVVTVVGIVVGIVVVGRDVTGVGVSHVCCRGVECARLAEARGATVAPLGIVVGAVDAAAPAAVSIVCAAV